MHFDAIKRLKIAFPVGLWKLKQIWENILMQE